MCSTVKRFVQVGECSIIFLLADFHHLCSSLVFRPKVKIFVVTFCCILRILCKKVQEDYSLIF